MSTLGTGVTVDSGLISHVDTNTYTVLMRAGEVYDVWADGDDPTLTISGPGGAPALADDDSAEGHNAVITFTAPTTGDYTVTVGESINDILGTGGPYILNIANRTFEADIADHTFKADPIDPAVGPAIKGADMILAQDDTLLSSLTSALGEHDLVGVYLASNTTYTFDMRGLDSGDGTVDDPMLRLLNADGVEQTVTPGAPVGNNEQFTFNPGGAGGLYFLDASGDFGAPTATYTLSFTSPSAVDVPGSTASISNLPLGNEIRGDIETSGDSDWYAVRLVAGQHYQFNLDAITLSDPELFLRDSTGSPVTSDNDSGGGGNSQITFTAGVSGLYFLDVRDHGVGSGTFSLTGSLTSALPVPNASFASGQGADTPEIVTGTDGSDSITGGGGDDSIEAGDGSDTVFGGAGGDFISLGGANDIGAHNIGDGGIGDDVIFSSQGGDLLIGGDGDDLLVAANDAGTVATVLGGDGNDFLNLGFFGDGSLDGGAGDDILAGGVANSTLVGGDGNDTLSSGLGGVDHMFGGTGNDLFLFVKIGDIISGGAGIDEADTEITYTLPADVENLTLVSGAGPFTDNFNGTGNGGANVIIGNVGLNVLSGLGGNDTVYGGAANDTLIGGAGKDLNTGAGGLDHIKFNALSESGTTFATRDAINTFAHGDKIDLSAIDANTHLAGNQAFAFSTSQSLTHVSGQLIAHQVATSSFLVQADVNGDGAADFSLNVYTAPGFGTFHNWDFII